MRALVLVAASLALLSLPASADTLTVPGDSPTIQAAAAVP
jgi:hypothetical protein